MFTGIVEELGEVVAKEELADAARFTVRGPVVTSDASHGDSIAVNGGVPDRRRGAGRRLLHRRRHAGDAEPVELAEDRRGQPRQPRAGRCLNSRLGGHLVQGHVDGTGHIISRSPSENWEVVRIALPDAISRYVVEKGSITVDGVSLTVSALGGERGEEYFEISLIPTTLQLTTLGAASVGTPVNLEVDVIAKYVERLQAAGR